MERAVRFYRTAAGRCPVEEFLDDLDDRALAKILAVFKLVETQHMVPTQYFKKLSGRDLWECRVGLGGRIFRFVGFWDAGALIVLTHGFRKEDPSTGDQQGLEAQGRLGEKEMSDVDRAIRRRVAKSPRFETMVEKELAELRIGLAIKELRLKNGMTQEQLARRLRTTKSAVSRLENRSGGARLETLEKVALTFGKELVIKFR